MSSLYLTCPSCGHPAALVIGPTQAMCDTPKCRVLFWNPTTGYDPDDPARNQVQEVDLSILEGLGPDGIELVVEVIEIEHESEEGESE